MNHAGLHNSARAADTTTRMSRALFIAALAVSIPACASSGVVYTPQPFPTPGGKLGTTAIPAPADPSSPPVAANPPVVPPAVATPPSMPGKPAPVAPPAHGNADGYALSGTALSLRGAPYKNGGVDPATGF